MADLILHHYPNSPFAEKVRVALGIKQLAWKSVIIPNMMPKPDLMPLTGGYRKTPVLQVGADIYCDTQLILLELEKRAPKPPLLPVGQEGEARGIAMWIDRNIFWAAVGVVMGAIGDQLPEAFKKDRSEFSGPGVRFRQAQGGRAHGPRADLRAPVAGRADAARRPALSAGRRAQPGRLRALQSRVVPAGAHGQGRHARAARPAAQDRRLVGTHEGVRQRQADRDAGDRGAGRRQGRDAGSGKVDEGDPSGLKAGQKVSVVPDDTGKVPVSGTLVGLTADRVSIIRSDPRVGDVVVHFPRAGYIVTPS